MLTINAPVFDIEGSLVIHHPDRAALSGATRRVTRSATLNGEASIADFGYTDADRTLAVQWPASEEQYNTARRMLRLYSRVVVSHETGCFLCAPSEISADDTAARFTLLVERKLSA